MMSSVETGSCLSGSRVHFKDGTVTKLKDGTEIHWIVNPNQDGVYQQKLDGHFSNQADADADDKVRHIPF